MEKREKTEHNISKIGKNFSLFTTFLIGLVLGILIMQFRPHYVLNVKILHPTNPTDDMNNSNPAIPTTDDNDNYSTESTTTRVELTSYYKTTSGGRKIGLYFSPKIEKMNWFEALLACNAWNKNLLSIESASESLDVDKAIKIQLDLESELEKRLGIIPDKYNVDDFWIAGTNLWTAKSSDFYWVTTGNKISNFTNWHVGTPNMPEEQHCIELTKDIDSPTKGNYKWNDYGCHIKARYICQEKDFSGH